jgi:hypothetical protein
MHTATSMNKKYKGTAESEQKCRVESHRQIDRWIAALLQWLLRDTRPLNNVWMQNLSINQEDSDYWTDTVNIPVMVQLDSKMSTWMFRLLESWKMCRLSTWIISILRLMTGFRSDRILSNGLVIFFSTDCETPYRPIRHSAHCFLNIIISNSKTKQYYVDADVYNILIYTWH